MLKVYNTLGKQLEEFKSISAGEVSIYVCGPTVYDYLHVGNFRGPVFFNFVSHWLEHIGYKVKYALNFTDIDDKIIRRAQEQNKNPAELSEYFIEEYKKDYSSLGLRPPHLNPKVTEHMPQIISMINLLIQKNKAYQTTAEGQGQDVNFSISEFRDYGKLSGRKPDELQSGVRIDVDEKKKNPLDFALWKSAKAGEISWKSPWGAGRPGWHIECSAMIKELFGDEIDIHGGGLDLMFPHHENEIAQSEACNDHSFARYWMHWNMIQFAGSKMSKSIGNIISLRDFLSEQHPEIYKWMMLSVHYRSTVEFGDEAIDRAISGLARIYSALALAENILESSTASLEQKTFVHDLNYQQNLEKEWLRISAALNDDFGTPAAFAIIFDIVRGFNSKNKRGMKLLATSQSQCVQFMAFLQKFGQMMSLFQQPAHQFLAALDDQLLKKAGRQRNAIDELIRERAQARLEKNFVRSDELRKVLTEMNIAVSDLATGSFWEVVK